MNQRSRQCAPCWANEMNNRKRTACVGVHSALAGVHTGACVKCSIFGRSDSRVSPQFIGRFKNDGLHSRSSVAVVAAIFSCCC